MLTPYLRGDEYGPIRSAFDAAANRSSRAHVCAEVGARIRVACVGLFGMCAPAQMQSAKSGRVL